MKRTTYKTAVHWLHNNLILCNDIVEKDPSVVENLAWIDQDAEIYQWYLTDCDDSDVEFLREHFPALIFSYSGLLGLWVLCVDHLGTSWDYVGTDTDLDNAPEFTY